MNRPPRNLVAPGGATAKDVPVDNAASSKALSNDMMNRSMRDAGILAYETLVARLTTTFVGLRHEDLTEGLRRMLAEVSIFLDIDRAIVAEPTREEPGTWSLTSEWYREDMSSVGYRMYGMATEIFPWSSKHLAEGQPVRILSDSDLPPEAEAEAAMLELIQIQSMVMIPVQYPDMPPGVVAFGNAVRTPGGFAPHAEELGSLLAEMVVQADERREQERRIHTAESRFRRIWESGVVGAAVTSAEGVVREANDAALEMLGYSREQLLRGEARWDEATAPEHRAQDQKALEHLYRQGYVAPIEKDFLAADGSRVPVECAAVLMPDRQADIMAIAVPIEAQRKAEHELQCRIELGRRINRWGRRFLDSHPEKIEHVIEQCLADLGSLARVDRLELFSVDNSKQVARLLQGWEPPDGRVQVESVQAVPLGTVPWCRGKFQRFEVIHIGDVAQLPPIARTEREIFESRGIRSFLGFPLRGRKYSAAFLTMLVSGEPVVWSEEEVGLYRLLAEMVYSSLERKWAADEVDAQNRELARIVQERTAALETSNRELETFSHAVSNDLRAPLRSIDGFSDIILEDFGEKLDDSGRALIHRTQAASRRLGELIDGLMSVAELSGATIERERLNLSELALQCNDIMRAAHPERQVVFEVNPDMIVSGERHMLTALLQNLISNAWKFTRDREAAHIRVGTTESGGETWYFVRDNGVGFDPEHSGRMFETFQRLHRFEEFEGHGVGLATAQRIVKLHDGDIEASGQPDQGATFRFTLGKGQSTRTH